MVHASLLLLTIRVIAECRIKEIVCNVLFSCSIFFFSHNAKRQRCSWAATNQTEGFPRGRREVEISTAKWLSWLESTSALTTRAVSAAHKDDRSGCFLPSFTHCCLTGISINSETQKPSIISVFSLTSDFYFGHSVQSARFHHPSLPRANISVCHHSVCPWRTCWLPAFSSAHDAALCTGKQYPL